MAFWVGAAFFAGRVAGKMWLSRRYTAARWGFRYLTARKILKTARKRRPSGRKFNQHPHRYKRHRR